MLRQDIHFVNRIFGMCCCALTNRKTNLIQLRLPCPLARSFLSILSAWPLITTRYMVIHPAYQVSSHLDLPLALPSSSSWDYILHLNSFGSASTSLLLHLCYTSGRTLRFHPAGDTFTVVLVDTSMRIRLNPSTPGHPLVFLIATLDAL